MAHEFTLIDQLFRNLGVPADEGVALNIGDDAAVFEHQAGEQLVMSVDTAVAGVHFPHHGPSHLIGYRTFMAAASDLAAMGANPKYASLCISIPQSHSGDWLQGLAQGIDEAAKHCQMAIIGGDTTSADAPCLSVQVFGVVPKGQFLTRSGAQIGEGVYVSGPLGGAAGALPFVLQQKEECRQAQPLIDDYYRPEPQLALGQALVGAASACLDISDGLVQDLGHLCDASKVGARIQVERVPKRQELVDLFGDVQAQTLALSGGDDYQLVCTLSSDKAEALQAQGWSLTRIGDIVASAGVQLTLNGQPFSIQQTGYSHF